LAPSRAKYAPKASATLIEIGRLYRASQSIALLRVRSAR